MPVTFNQNAARWEPHIHAFVSICDDHSKAVKIGPLSGILVGVKDIIDVAGISTRNGSETCAAAGPALLDADVVAALRTAGARIMGKTTTTEFAFTDPTPCRNPHDISRTPGGSSSGSGAAVAAGLVDVALGTQTAGSLCRPAAYCGVVGFKPTYSILSTTGVTPLAPSFDTVGIIAQSATLAKSAFLAMAPEQAPVAAPYTGQTVHCGLWPTGLRAAPDAQNAFNLAAVTLEALDLRTNNIQLVADVEKIVAAHRVVMNFEAAKKHATKMLPPQVALLKPKFLAGLRAGAAISPDQAQDALAYLTTEKRKFWNQFADDAAILTLPVPDGAPLVDGTTGYQDWLTPWTVFGGPLVSLPWGIDLQRRPRAVMLAAKPGRDMHLLSLAAGLEGHAPPIPKPRPPNI